MLISFSQPYFGQYDWKAPDADQNNGYPRDGACGEMRFPPKTANNR
jgi:hypothetical protein